MDDNGVTDWDDSPTGSRPFPDKHLSLPILTTLLDRFEDVTNRGLKYRETQRILGPLYPAQLINAITNACEGQPNLTYSHLIEKMDLYADVTVRNGGNTPQAYSPHDYPALLKHRLEDSGSLIDDISEAQDVAAIEINAYCKWISDLVKPSEVKRYKAELLQRIKLSEETLYWHKVASYWSSVCDESRKSFDKPLSKSWYKIGILTYRFWKGYFTCEGNNRPFRVGVYEQLQMLQDAARARFNVFLALDFKMHHGTDCLRKHVVDQFAWQEACIAAYGNEGYALAKYPEAIYKAKLTSLSGGDILPRSSYERTFDKIRLKEATLDPAAPLTKKLRANADKVAHLGDCAELFGLCKLSGHPSVYADYSGRAVQKAATSRDRSLPRSVLKMHRAFRHLFISGYIDKHSAWPPFVRPPLQGTKLHRHWINNASSLPANSYDSSDLDSIWFGKLKTIHFDYHEDYLQFLDDKALSVGVDRCATFWYGNGVPSAIGSEERERRLLKQFLKTERIDTVELVDRLRQGKFLPHEMLVELTQKEREFKPAARCFAKMDFKVRLYWVILESNAANFMEAYFPQQTMTMSEAQQKKRLYDMVRHWDAPDRAQLEVDFATWNNKWNKWNTGHIARDMEVLFGMPGAWSQVHDFFTKATIVVTDKNMIPPGADPRSPINKWPTSDLLWRDVHIGGTEGIQQKFWTICTFAMMYYALYDQPVSFVMAGQGDNHVFTLYFDTSKGTMSDILIKLLTIMEMRCAALNHEVKPEECLDSRTVLTYSKELYIRGVQQQYCLKFASRSFWLDDKSTPSLSREVSGVMACSQLCADTAPSQVQAITWKHILLRMMLRDRSVLAGSQQESSLLKSLLANKEQYRFASLLPGSLGGLPTTPWTRFFMKGEVDDLSWDVAGTIRSAEFLPSLGADLALLRRGKYSPKNPNPEQLISDPHSIPIDRPTDRTELIKRAVQSSPDIMNAKNVHVSSIMKTCTQDASVKKALAQTRPLFPDIMSDLYSWSPSGLRESILGRFNKTRTLADLTRGRFTSEIDAANCQLLVFIRTRFSAVSKVESFRCDESGFNICASLRSLWGCDLKNADIGTYTPFEFSLTHDLGHHPNISLGLSSDAAKCCETLGSQPPNFGTRTRAKLSEHGFRVYASGSAVKDLKGIVLTASELGSSEKLLDLCDQLAIQRSPWTARTLSPVLPTAFGGCASHRHTRLGQAHFSILGSRTVPTHISMCSDNAGQLSGGFYDYPVAFQAFYLTGTALVQQLAPRGLLKPDTWFGFIVPNRMEPISDQAVVAPEVNIPSVDLTSNPLAYTKTLMSSSVPDVPDKTQIPHLKNPASDQRSLLYSALLDWILSNRSAMMHPNSVGSTIDMMDLKEFLCCTPSILLDAAAAAVCSAGFLQCITKKKPDINRAEGRIMDMCDVLGGYLTRLFMHPMASSSAAAALVGAVSPAGRGGGTVAAHRVGEYLRSRCSAAILYKQWRNNLKLLLFVEHSSETTDRILAHSLLMLAMQHSASGTYRITDNQISLIKRVASYMNGDSSASAAVRASSCLSWLGMTRDPHYAASAPGVFRVRYVKLPANQALRELRARKMRVKPMKPNPLRTLTSLPVSGTYVIDKTLSGKCQRTCRCLPEAEHALRADLLLQSSRRQAGSYSALAADWNAVLRCSIQDAQVPIICVGVGHGGSARAALSLGTKEVQGIDLRSSFPDVPQREGSYKPPEVLISGLASRFTWHEHVWKRGGDILRWKGREDATNIVLDIDSNYRTTVRALRRCRGKGIIVVRTRCCPHELETLIDGLRPTHMWRLTVRHDIVRPSIVLVADRQMIGLESASGYRVTVLSTPVLNYQCGKLRQSELMTYIGYLLHITYSQPAISQNDIANEGSRLRQEASSPDCNPNVRRRLLHAADVLRDVILVSGRALIDISHDLRHFDKDAIRIAGRLNQDIFRDNSLPIRRF